MFHIVHLGHFVLVAGAISASLKSQLYERRTHRLERLAAAKAALCMDGIALKLELAIQQENKFRNWTVGAGCRRLRDGRRSKRVWEARGRYLCTPDSFFAGIWAVNTHENIVGPDCLRCWCFFFATSFFCLVSPRRGTAVWRKRTQGYQRFPLSTTCNASEYSCFCLPDSFNVISLQMSLITNPKWKSRHKRDLW